MGDLKKIKSFFFGFADDFKSLVSRKLLVLLKGQAC